MSIRTESGRELPLVSVVIPTYGRDEYLADAVQSVLDQGYDCIELFIVDDGSPTPVRETMTARSFDALEAVTFIRHNQNRGANVARNSGIRAASGKYVAFLDDDDRWEPEKIERQVEALESSGEAFGVAYTGKHTDGPEGATVTRPTAEGSVLKDLFVGKSFGQFSSVMVRADVIQEAGLPDERFPAWQDREWFFRLAQHSQFKAVPEILTYRRVGLPDRITKQFEQRRDVAYPLFVEKHYSLAREHGIYYARTFLASLRMNLARSAIRANRYDAAKKYFLLSFLANPLYGSVSLHLLASLGGERTYEAASRLRKQKQAVLSVLK